MFTSLKVKGIETSRHKSAQFAELSLLLPEENNHERNVYAFIRCKLYLVEGLKANILFGNNILALESFVFNVGLDHALVGSCRVKITIRAM